MARKRVVFLNSLWFLKWIILASLIFFLTISIKVKAEIPIYQAQDLTQKGYILLHQGQPKAALQAWEEAEKRYNSQGNKEGVFESLSNQSLAFQALGLPRRACLVLTKALNIEELICSSTQTGTQYLEHLQDILQKKLNKPITITTIINLGDTLRSLNNLEESQVVLQSALFFGQPSDHLLMSLGNTQLSFYKRTRNRLKNTSKNAVKEEILESIKSQAKSALDVYKKLEFSSSMKIVLKSKLNRLKLLIEVRQITKEFQMDNEDILNLIRQLINSNFDIFSDSDIDSVYTRLNFIDSLINLIQKNIEITLDNRKLLDISLKYSQESLQLAERLYNSRAISYAYGYLGKVYSILGLNVESISSFKKAIAVSQSDKQWDIAYQWQHSLGGKYRDNGSFNEAKEEYDAAINNINKIRQNLLSYAEGQYDFLEKVEPVYIDYVNMLSENPNFSKETVIEVYKQLQTVQLENLVQCHKNETLNTNKSNFEFPVIYLINLGERVDVFLKFQGKLHHHSPNYKEVKSYLNSLIKNIQDENYSSLSESRTILYSQAIYKLVIAPIEQYLPSNGTLAFVLGDEFQNVPMSLLYDGKNYLRNRYSMTVLWGLDIPIPRPLNLNQMNALLAGMSKEGPSFKNRYAPKRLSPLPDVEREILSIKKYLNKSLVLLNEEFTSRKLQQAINNGYSIVHISTHGQFSSELKKTMILTWDEPLNIDEMSNLLQNRKDNSIDLLVLSACEAAKGDRRSVLGIAGVAFQAHTRSTLASLWLVDAKSTAILMADFYSNLKDGKSKAEALRLAQIHLSSQPEYSHPYYWSPFILVGSGV
ncbi:CHAT domain-containing protein [Nostoc sp. KVJ3]|uniref:CHAT domain-containing protein n=1 Tax=Nostoc sp. KVJ3 TaxID=457945 RepID=UPI002237B58B|nr:CHAT domain-containing protein [Nostoc sp. KVJ3]